MLRNRPAAFLCLVFSAGIAAGLFFKYWIILLFAGAVAICFLAKKQLKKRFKIIVLACSALLIGSVYSTAFVLLSAPPTPQKGTAYSFNAAVVSTTPRSEYTTVELEVQDKNSPFNKHRVYMYLKADIPDACSVANVRGSVTESNVSAKSNGVDYIAYGSLTQLEGEKPMGLYYRVIAFRQKIGNAIEGSYNGDASGFYRALITGDRSKISIDTNASFSRSGILHILSVSGQHFSLLVFGLYRFLMAIFKHKKACSAVCIAAAIMYASFTGFTPSVVRAAFMCCVIFAANIIRERSDSLISLSVVLVIMLIIEPYAILNTGLQLSFLATLGIILMLNQLDSFYEDKNVKSALRALITPAALSVSASLFCIPIYLLGFDYVSVVSPITNIIANALVGPAMVCGIIAVPLKAVGLSLFTYVPQALFYLISTVSDICASFRFSCISLHLPFIGLLIIPSMVTAVVYCVFYVKNGMKVLLASAMASLAVCFGCYYATQIGYNKSSLLYIQEDKNNCYAFYAGENSYVLIDGGGEHSASGGALTNGCAYLDAYVVTDCTESALKRINKTLPYVPAKNVYIPESDSAIAKEIISYCKSKRCGVKLYNAENGLAVSGVYIYGAYKDNDESAFLIKGEKEGIKIAVLGKSEAINENIWDVNVFVVTRACTNSPYSADLLPTECEKAIIYKGNMGYLTDYITDFGIAKSIEKYKNSVCIRFGNDGIYEVIE